MKKIDEAVKRFGSPDYGRTAKRLRDFEAELVGEPCCDQMTVSGWCLFHNSVSNGAVPQLVDFDALSKLENWSDKCTRLHGEIEALQQLLNEKDYEIDMLRNIKPVSTRDLWFTAGIVALVLLGAYMGFM